MAKQTGPKCRLCRREGEKLLLKGARCSSEKCAFTRKGYPPGMHGQSFKKPSEYARQLRARQKACRIFGVSEKQMANYYKNASKKQGDSSNNLVKLLMMRFAYVVYLLGIVESPSQARQIVTHGHFLLNGRRVDIPSIQLKPGDTIELRAHSQNSKLAPYLSKLKTKSPAWLKFDVKTMKAEILDYPSEKHIQDLNINSRLIVEYYSR